MNKAQCIEQLGEAVTNYIANSISESYGVEVRAQWEGGDEEAICDELIEEWTEEFFLQ
jgi:hypothetical protein